jgi:hypothetical protein
MRKISPNFFNSATARLLAQYSLQRGMAISELPYDMAFASWRVLHTQQGMDTVRTKQTRDNIQGASGIDARFLNQI